MFNSSWCRGRFKEQIEALEVELEELKNINEFNDDMLQHKEADIEELDQKCEGLTQLNSQLMTRLEIMNREMNELKITSEEFDVKSEAGSASTGSGDRAGFTSVPGPENVALGINASAPRGADHKSSDVNAPHAVPKHFWRTKNLRTRLTSFVGRVNCTRNPS